ncbi:MAG: tetratricopeptide repeat protein, partial [Bacteroidota bacterium]
MQNILRHPALFLITLACLPGFLLSGCKGAKVGAEAPATPSEFAMGNPDKSQKIGGRYIEATTSLIRGEYSEAEQGFKDVLKMDPGNHAAAYNLAKLAMEQRRFEEAISLAQRALEGDRSNYYYHDLLRKIFEFQGDFPAAIKVMQGLVQEFPTRYQEQIRLAELQIRNKDAAGAIATLEAMEAKVGPNQETLMRKYQLYQSQNQPEKALETADALIDLNPEAARHYQMRFESLQKLDRTEEGIKGLEDMLKRFPENGYALLTLADYYKSKDNVEKTDMHLISL